MKFLDIGKEVDSYYRQFYDLQGLDILTVCNYDEMAKTDFKNIDVVKGSEAESFYKHMNTILDSTSADSGNKADLSKYSNTKDKLKDIFPDEKLNELNIGQTPTELKKLTFELAKPSLKNSDLSQISLIQSNNKQLEIMFRKNFSVSSLLNERQYETFKFVIEVYEKWLTLHLVDTNIAKSVDIDMGNIGINYIEVDTTIKLNDKIEFAHYKNLYEEVENSGSKSANTK